MGLAFILMMFGLLTGIFRLMSLNFIATGILSGLYGLHSIAMVFGFLAAMIMTERVAGVALIPGAKDLGPSKIMVPLILFGVIAELLSYVLATPALRYVGAVSLMGGCLCFLATLRFLRRNTVSKLPYNFMMLSVVALLLAAGFSAFSLPIANFGFIMLLISFPVLFILGERVELTRLVGTATSSNLFRVAFSFAVVSTALFTVGSVRLLPVEANIVFLLGSLLLFAVFLSVLFAENRNIRRLLKSPRPIQRYVGIHVRIAHLWGLVGMALATAYYLSQYRLNLYDSFIHALTVGFVGTMMLAHAPMILPGIMGRKSRDEQLTFVPLSILTLAVTLRIIGELLQLFSDSGFLRSVVALSGWLVLGTVLLFLILMRNGIGQDSKV